MVQKNIVALFLVLVSEWTVSAAPFIKIIGRSETHARWIHVGGSAPVESKTIPEMVQAKEAISVTDHPQYRIENKIPFMAEFWERFYFRLDDPADTLSNRSSEKGLPFFLGWNFTGRILSDYPEFILVLDIVAPDRYGRRQLGCRVIPSRDSSKQILFTRGIISGKTHCFELHCVFSGKDSVAFQLFLDGFLFGDVRTSYYLPKTYIYQSLGSTVLKTPPSFRLLLSGFAVSRDRFPVEPPLPSNLREQIDPRQVILQCDSFSSLYQGEKQTGTDWRLFFAGDSISPIYQYTTSDPRYFRERKVPFPLDSGDYRWQVRFQNNFGVTGEWSAPQTFNVPTQRKRHAVVGPGRFLRTGKDKGLTIVAAGEPCELEFHVESDTLWTRGGYFIIQMANRGYGYGHPGNKGGMFIPESNYVFNIAIPESLRYGRRATLYEKEPGTLVSRQLARDNILPRYFLSTPSDLLLDTDGGVVRLKFKLLEAAKPGPWVLSVSAFNDSDEVSNLYRLPFQVSEVRRGLSRRALLFAGLLAALTLAGAVLLLRRRRTPGPAAVDSEMKRMTDFIAAHLAEELSADRIRKELKLSSAALHDILRRNNVLLLPKLLNQIRVDKARELIDTTEMTMSEIGLELGFKELPYFTKVFKDYTGFAPSEYKKRSVRPPEAPQNGKG